MNTARIARSLPRHRGPRSQRGTMLMISLIVLVALTLAGIAMMRSVDTASLVAGNIAFKQSAVNASDQGIQDAYNWILSTKGSTTLDADFNGTPPAGRGYFSSVPLSESANWWNNSLQWTNAYLLNGGVADASGNIVEYVIHRMCVGANVKAGETDCGSTPDTTLVSGEGVDQSSPNFFTRPPAIHYRITVRTIGPRNSISIVQTTVRTQ